MNASELKTLKVTLFDLEKAEELSKNQLKELQESLKDIQKRKKNIQKQLDSATGSGNLIVTEHSILRYIERSMAVNIKDIEKHIKGAVEPNFKLLGNGTYPLSEGVKAVVKNGVVVTIM